MPSSIDVKNNKNNNNNNKNNNYNKIVKEPLSRVEARRESVGRSVNEKRNKISKSWLHNSYSANGSEREAQARKNEIR